MIDEAEASTEEDGKKRELVEAGIEADNAISAAELMMEESHRSHAEALTEEVWKAIAKIKEALAGDQADEVRHRRRELRELLGSIHRKVRNGAKQRS